VAGSRGPARRSFQRMRARKTTIVLADEETLLREGVVALCEKTREFRVVGHCGDGRSAIKLIRSLSPDVAVLDLGLPKLYALAVVRDIRRCRPSTKILIVSMRRDRKTVLEVLRSGANGYLLKNDPAECLLEALRELREGSIYVSPRFNLPEVFASCGVVGGEGYDQLSPRQHQVFTLLVQGLSGKQIAERLEISQKTVSVYRSHMMRKLDVEDLMGLAKFAIRNKLTHIR
jgi:two-component system response regulator NreC